MPRARRTKPKKPLSREELVARLAAYRPSEPAVLAVWDGPGGKLIRDTVLRAAPEDRGAFYGFMAAASRHLAWVLSQRVSR